MDAEEGRRVEDAKDLWGKWRALRKRMQRTFNALGKEMGKRRGTLVAAPSTLHFSQLYALPPSMISSTKNSHSVPCSVGVVAVIDDVVALSSVGASEAAASASPTDPVHADVAHKAISTRRCSSMSPRRTTLCASLPPALRVALVVGRGGGGDRGWCFPFGSDSERDMNESTDQEWWEQELHLTRESNWPVIEPGASTA